MKKELTMVDYYMATNELTFAVSNALELLNFYMTTEKTETELEVIKKIKLDLLEVLAKINKRVGSENSVVSQIYKRNKV